MYLAAGFIFSRKLYDTLPPDVQEAVLEAGRQSVIAQRQAMETMTNEALVELQGKGLEFFEVDRDAFRREVESVYRNNAESVGGLQAIEEVIGYR
jgi:TRAP-type C4-dicarboxylate transport system substrate-binding protein